MSAPPDGRSVGELLVEAEQQVRNLLFDAADRAGLGMAQGWVEVVGAAAELWQALPRDEGADASTVMQGWATTSPAPEQERKRPADAMDQLVGHAASVQKRIARTASGQGSFATPTDDTLVDVAGLYYRAADLVQRYKPGTARAPSAQLLADADASRARIMHTLYVTSHAATVALSDDLSKHVREGITPTAVWTDAQRRIGASEQIAGTYVRKTYPDALRAEHRPPVRPGRLAGAQSGWDVEAHRALAKEPTVAVLQYVASQEAFNAQVALMLWRACAEAGHIDQGQYRTRLSPALEGLHGSWERSLRVWEALDPRTDGLAPTGLRAAGDELRAATRELLHDQAAPAGPELVAARTDLRGLVPTLHNSLATSVDLAHAFRDDSGLATIQVAPKPAMAMQNLRLKSMPFPNMRWQSQEQARSEGGVPLDALNRPSTPLPPVLVPMVRSMANTAVQAAARTMGAAIGIEGNGRTGAEPPRKETAEPAPSTATERMARWRTAMSSATAIEGHAR